MIAVLNDLGVDPNECFDPKPNPLDSMPIATDNPRPEEEVYDWYDTAPSEYEPPMQDSDWFIDKPEEKEETMHEKMYQIATSKYNPFSVGGSESIHDFEGGSENVMS